MRGGETKQSSMLCLMSPEGMVPERHLARRIKKMADECLAATSSTFDAMYAGAERPSISSLRAAQLQLLLRWFLDMDIVEPTFDSTTFTRNRERLLAHDAASEFFPAVVEQARKAHLMSSEHFTVDGTLIDAWASLKSFKRKDGQEHDSSPPDDPGNPTVNFHGEKRSNETTLRRRIQRRSLLARGAARRPHCRTPPMH